jgi:uncharacterized protein YecE (DUF72 family)
MKIHIGVNHFPLHAKKINSICDVSEVSSFFDSRPKKGTLVKWRENSDSSFRYVIPAPRALTDPYWKKEDSSSWNEGAQGFINNDVGDKIWAHLDRAAGVLRSQTLLFVTPIDFRPNSLNKKKMTEFFSSKNLKNYKIVWEPTGLWDPKEALDFAKSAGITVACDPLSEDFVQPDTSFRYFRVHSLRKSSGISQMGFEDIYDASIGAKRVFVIFTTPKALNDAKKFKTFLSEQI